MRSEGAVWTSVSSNMCKTDTTAIATKVGPTTTTSTPEHPENWGRWRDMVWQNNAKSTIICCTLLFALPWLGTYPGVNNRVSWSWGDRETTRRLMHIDYSAIAAGCRLASYPGHPGELTWCRLASYPGHPVWTNMMQISVISRTPRVN